VLRRSSPVPLTPQASVIAHQFHHLEISAVDSSLAEKKVNYHRRNAPPHARPDEPSSRILRDLAEHARAAGLSADPSATVR
jgi:hypothetical protein